MWFLIFTICFHVVGSNNQHRTAVLPAILKQKIPGKAKGESVGAARGGNSQCLHCQCHQQSFCCCLPSKNKKNREGQRSKCWCSKRLWWLIPASLSLAVVSLQWLVAMMDDVFSWMMQGSSNSLQLPQLCKIFFYGWYWYC